MRSKGATFDQYILMSTEIQDDTIVGGVDAYGDADNPGSIAPSVVHYPFGLYACPLDPVVDSNNNPDPTQSCQSFGFWMGGRLNLMPSYDPRVLPLLPNINKGDAIFYGGDGSFVRINNKTHTITQSTTLDGTVSGASIFTSLGPDGFFVIAPWGKLELSPRGFHVSLPNGARIDLGGASLPGPLAALSSVATISASIVNVAGVQTLLGVGSVYLPVVHALPTDMPPVVIPLTVSMCSGSVKVAMLS